MKTEIHNRFIEIMDTSEKSIPSAILATFEVIWTGHLIAGGPHRTQIITIKQGEFVDFTEQPINIQLMKLSWKQK